MLLGAERPADVGGDDMDLVGAQSQGDAEVLAGVVHGLGGHPHGQALELGIPFGDHPARLQRMAGDTLDPQAAADDVGGALDQLVDLGPGVAANQLDAHVRAQFRADERCVRGEGVLRIPDDRSGRVEGDVDELGEILGDRSRSGDDDADRLSDVADVRLENGVVHLALIGLQPDAWQRVETVVVEGVEDEGACADCGGRVDPSDLGGGERAAQDVGVEHARAGDVGDEATVAAEQPGVDGASDPRSDERRPAHLGGCHHSTSVQARRTAARIPA